MPVILEIEPNPNFKAANTQDKAVFEKIKKHGVVKVEDVTATEAVRNSKGMYRIRPVKSAAPLVASAPKLEDLSSDELKEMAAMRGITIRKSRVSKADLITAIRETLQRVEVTEDEEDEDEEEDDSENE